MDVASYLISKENEPEEAVPSSTVSLAFVSQYMLLICARGFELINV